jgi:hypothetical protein
LVFKEAKYTAVLGYQRRDWVAVLDLLKSGKSFKQQSPLCDAYCSEVPKLMLIVGKLKPANMITRRIKLEDLVEKGFLALTNDKDNHVKILVDIQT